MFKSELKRAILSPYFIIGTIVLLLSFILGVIFDIVYSENTDLLQLYTLTTTIGTSILIMPVVTALPFVGSYCYDVNAGYFDLCIIRTDKKNYVGTKIAVAICSGFFMVFLSLALFYIITIAIRPSVLRHPIQTWDVHGGYWNELVEEKKEWVVLGAKSIMLCFYGGLWPVIGMALSGFISNKYFVMAMPFLVSELVSYITQYSGLVLFQFDNIPLRGSISELVYGGIPFALCYWTVLVGAMSVVFHIGVGRKMRNG